MTHERCPTTGKVQYRSKHALNVAHRHITGNRVRAYRCPDCSHWHATSSSKRKNS